MILIHKTVIQFKKVLKRGYKVAILRLEGFLDKIGLRGFLNQNRIFHVGRIFKSFFSFSIGKDF